MTPKQIQIAKLTRHLLSNSPSGALESVSQLPVAEVAMEAVDNALNDVAFRPGQASMLEAVVLPKLRPAALIKKGDFPDLDAPWAGISVFRKELQPVIQAVGRVEVANISGPFGGSGFLCGPKLMLTNRHVAELFIYGSGGSSRLRFIPSRPASFQTGHEHLQLPVPGFDYRVTGAVVIHPFWDAALLKVEYVGELDPALQPAPLKLCATPPDEAGFNSDLADVVVIGYPYWSDGHSPAVMKEIFNDLYGVKRFQPGRLTGYKEVGSFGNVVRALTHDCSTLGGNSGSMVADVQTQQVMALHFAGTYLENNFAVPMWELAKDPRLVDAGMNFTPAPVAGTQPRTPEEGGPVWLRGWRGRENEPASPQAVPPPPAEVAAAPPPGVAVPAAAPAAAPQAAEREGPPPLAPERLPLIDPGWFERYSDEELRRLYQRDPEGFRQLLAATFSEEEAREIYETLLIDAATEGLFTREPDPSLPEIVLLPGIMGSHLRGSFLARSWFNALTLPFSNLLLSLGLDPNGNDHNNLRPDGYIEMNYSKAARTWRQQRYMVHEFSYDWRLPLATSARRLADFLRARRRARPEARFALVCHSMGSLVASIYSRDHADWRDHVSQAVLIGGPLGGSFAIMEMLSGEYATVVKLAKLSLATSLEEMRRMGATFPGALEMLPHPDLFGNHVETLYQPRSYAGLARPGADWLRAARRIKSDLRDSPLLGRATCLVCVDRRTACDFQLNAQGEVFRSPKATRGDATVPATSSLVSGVPAFKVDFEHGELLKDPKVIEAVPYLLRGQKPPLDAVDRSVIDIPLPPTEAALEAPAVQEAHWEIRAAEVREKIRNGVLTSEDQRWLMSQY